MSKGSKGGGGATHVNLPTNISKDANQGAAIGNFASNIFPSILSMTNWASDIATGGNAQGASGTISSGFVAGNDDFRVQGGTPTAFTSGPGGGQESTVSAGQVTSQQQAAQNAQDSLLGPFLTEAWGQVGQGKALQQELNIQAGQEQAQGNTMIKDAMTGDGLFPSQRAMIDQAVTAEQAAVASQLGAEGLASSTAAPILKGEVAQQGAASAGQLVQGNIALGQASQKLAQGAEALSAQEQAALEQEAQGLQKQSWDEAMAGFGALGNMITSALSGFNLSLSGLSQYTQAEIASAGNATSAANAAGAQSASAFQTLGSGLGSILGGGSGGGGLLGSLGGLFGGGGSTIAGAVGADAGAFGGISAVGSSIAGGAGAAAGGIGSALGSIGGIVAAIGSIFGF
jgi:hypothetical protein